MLNVWKTKIENKQSKTSVAYSQIPFSVDNPDLQVKTSLGRETNNDNPAQSESAPSLSPSEGTVGFHAEITLRK